MSISRCWLADDAIYQVTAKNPSVERYQLLNGGVEDYKRVAELFQKSISSKYTLSKVEVIYNPALEQSFEAVVQGLAKNNNLAERALDDLRSKMASRLKQIAHPLANTNIKLLPLFLGTHPSQLTTICESGYHLHRNGSKGFLGKAIYHSSYAEYAVCEQSSGTLLLNWVALRAPEPIVREDLKTLKRNPATDAHYALVGPQDVNNEEEVVFLPIDTDENPVYDDWAIFEPIQILPRYIISYTQAAPSIKELIGLPGRNALSKVLVDLSLKVEDEFKNLLVAEFVGQDAAPNLNPAQFWLYKHSLKLLSLQQDSEAYRLLAAKVVQFLKRIQKARPKLAAYQKHEKADEDYIKARLYLRSEDVGLFSEAVKLLTKAAKREHAGAFFELGNCYNQAKGVKRDDNLQLNYYALAANRGHAEAQFILSQHYKTCKRFDDAIRYAQMAADQGHPGAQDYIGHCYYNGFSFKQSYEKACNWFKLAADQGNESSRYYLALCYRDGHGIIKSPENAFRLWLALAEEGNHAAQYQVCQCYKTGDGVKQDFMLAIRYALLAANGGESDALEYVGHCYLHGLTLPKDSTKALAYFIAAAAKGHAAAQEYLGAYYSAGLGAPKDLTLAAKYNQKAADQGRKAAQLSIGIAYKDGLGIAVDKEKALKYLKLAAEQGVKQATELLEEMGQKK